jgi:hypothetical protein
MKAFQVSEITEISRDIFFNLGTYVRNVCFCRGTLFPLLASSTQGFLYILVIFSSWQPFFMGSVKSRKASLDDRDVKVWVSLVIYSGHYKPCNRDLSAELTLTP